jgi:molybdenum cofactor cytidylyltransferase
MPSGKEGVAAVLLAAGASTRFGSPKMLAPVGGEPLLRRVARSFVEAGFAEVAVVLAPGAEAVAGTLAGLAVLRVTNPRPEDGMLSSVRAGLAALGGRPGRVAVTPADLPGLTAPVLRRLLEALPASPEGAVVVPCAGGRRGHPLVLPAALVPRILEWDPGRRLSDVLREPGVAVHEVPGFGPEVFRDVDVPADLPGAAG